MAGEATCLSCHGIEFAGILPEWEAEMQTRVDAVSGAVGRVRRALGGRPSPVVDSLLSAAEENVALVGVGKGAHNIQYADEVLRAALRMAQEAARAGGVDPGLASVQLGPPIGEGGCATCHFGEGARGGRPRIAHEYTNRRGGEGRPATNSSQMHEAGSRRGWPGTNRQGTEGRGRPGKTLLLGIPFGQVALTTDSLRQRASILYPSDTLSSLRLGPALAP